MGLVAVVVLGVFGVGVVVMLLYHTFCRCCFEAFSLSQTSAEEIGSLTLVCRQLLLWVS